MSLQLQRRAGGWGRCFSAFLLIGSLGACGSDASPSSGSMMMKEGVAPGAGAAGAVAPAMPSANGGSGGTTGVSPGVNMPAGMDPATPPAGSNGNAGSVAPSTPNGPADPNAPTTGTDPQTPDPVDVAKGGRIYWLDILGNGVYSALPDGSEMKRIADSLGAPDGVGVDDCTGTIYFSNMGSALGNSGRASVQRASWDGSKLETLVAPGSGVNTAKQLTLDLTHGHVYFADREGAKVWRMKLDGSELMPVVSGHDFAQLVGVAVDADAGHLYFTDRNRGLLLRAGLELPAGQTAADRKDIETLAESPSGAMPIDLALDLVAQQLYWTDRKLGTLKRIGLALPAGDDPAHRSDEHVVLTGLTEPIGVSLDVPGGKLYVTEAGGGVHRAALDGSGAEVIARTSSATGIAFALIGPDGAHRVCP